MTKSKRVTHVILLMIVLAVGVYIFFIAPGIFVKRADIIAMSLVYPLWGAWHHYEDKNLNLTVILEYTLIAMITFVVLWSILPSS